MTCTSLPKCHRIISSNNRNLRFNLSRGCQKQTKGICKDLTTIGGRIESILNKYCHFEEPGIIFSSRTDAGVHALNNTAHIDFQFRSQKYSLNKLITSLNKNLYNTKLPIVIKKIRRVPETFNARFCALSRTYLYRIAVPQKGQEHMLSLPIEEHFRSHLIKSPSFDIEKFKEAANLFEGRHDFETFRKSNKSGKWKNNIRLIYSINIDKSLPILISHNQYTEIFEFYDIKIRGKSFVHNQVRRIVGALQGVSEGKLTLQDIQVMLQVPSKHSWPSSIDIAPACGLYLCDVEYAPECLAFENQESYGESR